MTVALQERRQQLQLLRRREELKSDNGVYFYQPHPKQELFHRAGEYVGRYARTGNRFGKSEMGAAEDIAWAMGYRAWLPEGDPGRYAGIPQHPVKLLVVCTDWPKASEVFTSMEQGKRRGKLFRLLPKNLIEGTPHKQHGGHVDIIRVKSKWGGTSAIYIDTQQAFKQNPMGAESSDWDAIHVDEPISHTFWRAISRGLIDREGKFWFTCTPLSEMWINNLFLPPERLREERDEPFLYESAAGRLWIMTGSVYDNPHISKEAATRFLAGSLTDAERQCRERGIPTALSGTIFKEFDPMPGGKHVKDFEGDFKWKNALPPENFTYYVAIDPHLKNPHAVLFLAVNPLNQKFVFNELYTNDDIPGLCRQIANVLQGRKPARIVCDPVAWTENQLTGIRMVDEFWANGLCVEQASKELAYGILKTQEALKEDKEGWVFDCAMKRFRWEINNYVWDTNKEKPLDTEDHIMECFRRLVLLRPEFVKEGHAPKPIPPTDFRKVNLQDMPSRTDMLRAGRQSTVTLERPKTIPRYR